MCGIAGIIALNRDTSIDFSKVTHAAACLAQRGPDHEGFYKNEQVALAHRRLSIIDTSNAASQPLTDVTGRYVIVFNGEFFNYREHRQQLQSEGVIFQSESDTEVLLQLYIRYGVKCLDYVNGFFAFCIYDNQEQSVLIARDRMGVKPLLYSINQNKLLFASEMKALLALGVKQQLDTTSLCQYLQLNYIPEPWSIYNHIKKLAPGNFLYFKLNQTDAISENGYYEIIRREDKHLNYHAAQQQLYKLMDDAVEKRLVSDVPLGCFLSGGVDSSVITALAAQKVKKLNTFSIGYKDEPFYDETQYALEVAKMHGTQHHVFKLSNDELYENLDGILNYIDEPFADSSAIAVYILSKYTRQQVTVALSGDGADELFAGYQKHRAEWMVRHQPWLKPAALLADTLLPNQKGSRNSAWQNKVRQLKRLAEGVKLTPGNRYLRWCAITSEADALQLFNQANKEELKQRNQLLMRHIKGDSLNDVLLSDMKLVLTGDMLRKVDSMSMANSLEVRNPFLDFRVVDFAFSIPENFKINKNTQKRMVKDAFRNLLPASIYHRGKRGFEVPLLKWMQTHLKSRIMEQWMHPDFIREQGVFNPDGIAALKQQLFHKPDGETQARIWAIIVFQNWWLTYHQPSLKNNYA
jgi:asparagine synthase (glutamine-hydrolysing)